MAMPSIRFSIRFKLVVLSLGLAAAPAIAVTLGGLRHTRRQGQAMAQAIVGRGLSQLEDEVRGLVGSLRADALLARGLAEPPEHGTAALINRLLSANGLPLERFLSARPSYRRTIVVGADGRLLASYGPHPWRTPQLNRYAAAAAGLSPSAVAVLVVAIPADTTAGLVPSRPTLVAVVPIAQEGGRAARALVLEMEADTLLDVFRRASGRLAGVSAVAAGDGRLLYHSIRGARPQALGAPSPEDSVSADLTAEEVRLVLSGRPGELVAGDRLLAYRTVAVLGERPADRLIAYHVASRRTLMAPVLQHQRRITLELAFVLAMALIAAVLLSDHLVRPIVRLRDGVRALAEGRSKPLPAVRTHDELEELARDFATMAHEVTRRREELEVAVEETRRRNRELFVLYSIDRAAAQSADLEEILSESLERALDVLGVEAGGLYLLEPDGETMTLRMHRGLSHEFVRNVQRIKLGEGVSGMAAAQRKPVVLDVAAYPTDRLAPYIAREGSQTLASTPLLSGGQLVGALNLGSRRPHLFTSQDLDLLASVGSQLGVVVQNARLHAAARQELAERRSLEGQLRQAQKMEAIGQLAGGLAHDFNNLLTTILATSELLDADLPADSPAREDLQAIRRAGERGADLTRKLLAFSRRQRLEVRPLKPARLVGEFAKMVRRMVREDIAITLRLQESEATIDADPGAVEQILMNLVTNARDAMPAGGTLLFETGLSSLDEASCAAQGWGSPGEYAVLAVSDTGVGMDEATKQRIFEPFFTTKPAGEGTGLGMAMIYGLITQHGGFVHVESEPGRGTTVRLYFPVVAEAVEAAGLAVAPEVRGGTETILLAEDDEALRRTAKRVLEKHGYRVLLAADGAEALQVYGAHEREIALLIADIVMPKLGGPELWEQLREAGRAVTVLFTSGYTDRDIRETAALPPDLPFLSKPWTIADLLRRVREVLDKPHR